MASYIESITDLRVTELTPDSSFLDGGGELGALMRAYDWRRTPLGPPAGWPRSLKTAVRILLTSRQPFWLGWGPELTYLYNDAYRSIVGGKHPHALGRPFKNVWHEILDVVGPMADRVMSCDEGVYVEAQLLVMERNGYQEETYYTFSFSPIPNDEGGVGGLLCASTDDTRRVIGERQLATLRELAARTASARTLLDAAFLCVEALSNNARDVPFSVVYLAADAPGGFEPIAASPGTSALKDPARWTSGVAVSTNGVRVVPIGDATGLCPRGAWTRPPTLAAVIPIDTAQGGLSGMLVVGLNPFRVFDEGYRGFVELLGRQVGAGLANGAAHEQEVRRAEALAELDRAKTAFFSSVSHEFRTPLTLMLGPLEDTLRADALAAADRERIDLVHRNALRLLKLVNALLDFSRIEAGRIDVRYEPADLGALTSELASVFRSAVERAQISFVVSAEELSEPVHVDPEMWEKILHNLLSNAFKFTFEGEIEVRTFRAGDRACVSVRDTGTGIPEEEIPRLFERFHQVRHARGRSIEGSGIGLALVEELVKLHGGTIRVDSEIGRGSTFTVAVPFGVAHLPAERVVARAAKRAAVPEARAHLSEVLGWRLHAAPGKDRDVESRRAAPEGAEVRILLADDNADMRDYVRGLLEDRYVVEAVADGAAALEAARLKRPDLVLTDVMMPGVDGFALVAAIRKDPRLRTVPVILLSARAGHEAQLEGLSAGADDYLEKPFGAGELLARIGTRLELTRVREALEKELGKSEQRYRNIFELAGVSIWEEDFTEVKSAIEALGIVDPDDLRRYLAEHPEFVTAAIAKVRVVDVNDTTLRMFGASHEKELTESLHRVFTPGTATVFAEELVALARGQTHFEGRTELRTLSGEPLWVILTVVFPPAGLPMNRVLVTLTDVTALERAERALAEEARRKDEFLATLSHELRNPLSPLKNSLHVLRMESAGPAQPIHAMMERQVDHLVRLVDDLLEMSRINSGAFELRQERVLVGDVVRHAIETSEPLVRAGGHALTVSLPESPVVLDGDRVRLSQIIANILNNAAKYTDPGGRISVEVRAEGEWVAISVTDDGAGIAETALPRLFEMFNRGDPASRRGQDGLGIGLALARRLVEMHGGTVSASSPGLGFGSCFTVRLPLAEAQQTEAARASSRPAAAATWKNRILVVDDNQDSAETLGMLLELLGADVRVALDGAGALAAFAEYDPAMVLLDIGMPDIDGYEVARRLRAAWPGRRSLLVALTGWGQEDDRRRAREAGFDHHLVKPADVGALRSLLSALPGGA